MWIYTKGLNQPWPTFNNHTICGILFNPFCQLFSIPRKMHAPVFWDNNAIHQIQLNPLCDYLLKHSRCLEQFRYCEHDRILWFGLLTAPTWCVFTLQYCVVFLQHSQTIHLSLAMTIFQYRQKKIQALLKLFSGSPSKRFHPALSPATREQS